MAIRIGEAVSVRNPENFTVTPDDRQQLIQLVGGVMVQDNGRFPDGDKFGFTAVFDLANWALIEDYWANRTKVTFVDEHGIIRENCRIRVTSYSYVKRFNKISANIEVWRI